MTAPIASHSAGEYNRMYATNEEQYFRGGDSSVGLDEAEDDVDLDEESISLANELLPEYYDIAGSVRSQEVYPMERQPSDDTRMIVQDLIDRVERLSRENSLLKQINSRNGQTYLGKDSDYMDLPTFNSKLHNVSETVNWSAGKSKDPSIALSSPSRYLNGVDEFPVRDRSSINVRNGAFSPTNYSTPAKPSDVVSELMMPRQRVTFNESRPESCCLSDSSVQSEFFRARVLQAIQRHREAVSELRNLICSELSNGVYNSYPLSSASYINGRSGPGMLRWQADDELPRRITSSPCRVNLRKPIWFRDILSNE